ncbi:MAG: gamma-glutamyl-gamma-aminobutyrate hydrolase family protein [Candidatus Sericytochromatia bacterium]
MIPPLPVWIAVTQRVVIDPQTAERRDALDQRWGEFLANVGVLPLLLPNSLPVALSILANVPVSGLLLTGGNSLVACGGDAPERDQLEFELLALAKRSNWPVLGVCRGMQVIQTHLGHSLKQISGHVVAVQEIQIHGQRQNVNSYHTWGNNEAGPECEVWAKADDGIIKAIRHKDLPWWGMMWHPERIAPFRNRDLAIFREVFAL